MSEFPIPRLDQLPTRITPCPIVEAVLEIRFVTDRDWSLLPGLLFTRIQERYPRSLELPTAKIPDDIRRADANLVYAPLTRFIGESFKVQLGPRVISLIADREYPGWTAVAEETRWLLEKVQEAGFITEGERLGMRYIDFFPTDVFPHLTIQFQAEERAIEGFEMNFTTAFKRDGFTARLVLNNGALVRTGENVAKGTVIDLDLWLGPSDFEVFENAFERFEQAHQLNKELFFGLLKPDFLASLSPEYE